MVRKLFELAGAEDDRVFSPFVWRIRMSLAHKNLDAELVPVRFTEKDKIAYTGSKTFPVLDDSGTTVFDSWDIAEYLERTYPEGPSLFGGESGRSGALFICSWIGAQVLPHLMPLIIFDIYEHLAERDQAYFRTTREQRIGMRLEDAQAGRDAKLETFRASLQPARLVLQKQQFLAGTAPNYMDYALFGCFQWARAISPFTLLEADDPLYHWRDRLLAAFDGLAGAARGYPV